MNVLGMHEVPVVRQHSIYRFPRSPTNPHLRRQTGGTPHCFEEVIEVQKLIEDFNNRGDEDGSHVANNTGATIWTMSDRDGCRLDRERTTLLLNHSEVVDAVS